MFRGTQEHCAVCCWIKLASHVAELVKRKESVSNVGIHGHKMQSWLCLSSPVTLQHVGDPALDENRPPDSGHCRDALASLFPVLRHAPSCSYLPVSQV